MSEWKTYKLGDFAEINPKVTLKPGSTYSFVEMKDLNASLKYVQPSIKKELKGGSKFKNKDTLFARITPCLENGKICQVKNLDSEIGFGSTEFMVFRGKDNVSDTDFVYYLTRTEYLRSAAIQAMTGTSGRQRVEKASLEKLDIVAPELLTQRLIASILSSLDEKIELNLQINQTLANIARAVFEEWFVKFNFPDFDGKLAGGLPKDWNYRKISEICDVTDFVANGSFASLAEKVEYKSEADYSILVRLTDYNRGFDGDFVYISESAYNFLGKSKLFGGEIIIANVGANAGDVFRAPYLNRPMSLGPNAIMIKNNIYTNYLYLFLTGATGQHLIKSVISGSAQPKFNKTDFRNIELVCPPEILINKFNDFYSSLHNRLILNFTQIKNLIELRDSLLPQLMTGKIEIPHE